MSGKIEISRELAERIAFIFIGLEKLGITPSCAEELRQIIAAPVVERQPVAYIVEAIDPNNGHLRRRGLHWHSVETLRGTRDFKEWIGENVTKEQPLYTSPPAQVSTDIAHDRAYRNGMMAGFQFGISGNEKGYALAIANFNSEIHAAKGEPPAPVAVVLPERLPTEPYKTIDRGSANYKAGFNACIKKTEELNACLDKVKELNQ